MEGETLPKDGGRITAIIREICSEISAELVLEHNYGLAGYVRFKNERRCYFKNTKFDINGSGACAIAEDKDFCASFLSKAGINTPRGQVLYSPRYKERMRQIKSSMTDSWRPFEDALSAVRNFGLPLYVKPNDGRAGGGVAKTTSIDALLSHVTELYRDFDILLVQPAIPGKDYRVVILDNEVCIAYKRTPLEVTGDGTASVFELIREKVKALKQFGRNPKISLCDNNVRWCLEEQGLTVDSVAPLGTIVTVLPNANLSTGGDAVEVTNSLNPKYAKICVDAAKAVGLRLAGVDLICNDIGEFDENYCVLEVNSSPGLLNFASLGDDEADSVKSVYRKLLTKFAKA